MEPVNDRKEGIVRDPVNYKGEIVSYVKDIGNGDPGYDASVRQVLIMKQDGTEIVVPETDILREKKTHNVAQSHEPDRRPDQTLPQAQVKPGDNAQERDPAPEPKPAKKEGE